MTPTALRAAWGQRLRRLREEQGLTLDALGAQAGVTKGQLSRIENGLSGISDDMKVRLARSLGIEVVELFPYPTTTGSTDPR